VIARRDLIAGAMALAAAGTAEALRPRHTLVLLDKGTMKDALPNEMGGWQADATAADMSPELAGGLAQTLYGEIVSRVYYSKVGAVMLLAAYGKTQSDALQLHRPEVCYPAVGYAIESSAAVNVALPGGAQLPVRKLVVTNSERRENILYWTRVGELLPQSGEEQRAARFKNAFQGLVPDGVLLRCSTLGDSDAGFKILNGFIEELIQATAPAKRPALVGTEIAKRMNGQVRV
jgi:EpsI family protein